MASDLTVRHDCGRLKVAKRPVGRSLWLTLPIALWSLLMFGRSFRLEDWAPKVAALLTTGFCVTLFYLMLRTRHTYRWRRVFFVALGFLFPIGFIWDLMAVRGSMSISIERMVSGDTPFCFLAIPMMIIPAALKRTLIFPGSVLPTASNPHSIASAAALWLAGTIVLGKGWCAFGCFFGGIEEGFAAIARKARLRNINPQLRYLPWALLAAIVLLSAATFEPIYCAWLCPFKAVTEYSAIRSLETAIQAGIFVVLFVGLVVVLPLLTKRRTQCAFFCPFGAFESLFNKLNVVEIRIDQDKCSRCMACIHACPTLAIDGESLRAGRMKLACMKCGACVDRCLKAAAVWHIKGTSIKAPAEIARLLYLFAAWSFAVMLGGSIIANTLTKILRLLQ